MADQRVVIKKLMEEVQKALREPEDDYTDRVTGYYDKFLKRVNTELMDMYNRAFRDGKLNFQDYKRLQLEATQLRILHPALNELQTETANELAKGLNGFYWHAYQRNAWAIDQTTPPNNDLALIRDIKTNPENDPFLKHMISLQVATPWKGAMFSDRLGHINNAMARDIQTLTNSAAINGWSVPDLSQSIRDLVGVPEEDRLVTRPRASAAKMRADMIARTELLRAANLAREQIFKDNGDLVETKVWLSAEDARTCEDCYNRDGMTAEEVTEEMDSEDQDLDFNPPAHPRCRCTWIPKLKSWKKLLGPEFGKGMEHLEHIDEYEMKYFDPRGRRITTVEVQPYDEWLKAS